MKFIFSISIVLLLLASCGLKYTPVETREDLNAKRKKAVEAYILESYKDTSVTYQSLLFASPTLIKPYQHRQLDSLYAIKFNNEQAGKFDKELEEKINTQRLVVETSRQKMAYIEHHIYNIVQPEIANIYYADITLNNDSEVTNFKITADYQFPSSLLSIFKSYVTRESLIYSGYRPTTEEMTFYNFFDEALERQPIASRNSFLTNMLTVFQLARNVKSLDTKLLLQYLAVIQVENRQYSSQIDKFSAVDGIYDNGILSYYELNFSTPMGKFIGKYSPYFEVISIDKIQ